MNAKLLFLAFSLFLCSFRSFCQPFNTQDSLALVDLYNSTNGPGWINHTNWLTSKPVYTWFGIATIDGTRVTSLTLSYNNLSGVIPASLGNLAASWGIDLSGNRLTGSLPSSLANLIGVNINLSTNQLSGTLPDFSSTWLMQVNISYNKFNFATLDPFCVPCHAARNVSLIASPQADLPLIQNGNTLSISAGGTLSHNTYTWYKDGAVVAVRTGDSTYTMTGAGNYSVAVDNSNVQAVVLYSIQNTNFQDSLTLIDLYNSTGGSNWLNNDSWASSAPVATWYGIRTKSGRVNEVSLNYNKLAGPLPSSLGGLQSLTNLAIVGNQLTGSIPGSIGNLANLRNLNISGGQLSGGIPSSLGGLKALQGLFLANDHLTGGTETSYPTPFLQHSAIAPVCKSFTWKIIRSAVRSHPACQGLKTCGISSCTTTD